MNFIRRKENVTLVGVPGTGKTHLAFALGRRVRASVICGKLKQFRSKLEKVDLMILDEIGYLPFGKEGAELLFQIISEFYEQKSLIITSNLEFSQ